MTDIGAKARAEVKDIWEQIKAYPAVRSMGLELIALIKRKAMNMPEATDEKITTARKAFAGALVAVSEPEEE